MVAGNNQLRHYAYPKANADMKQQRAAASAPAPDMDSRKRNGTSDEGGGTSMQSYANDRYFSQHEVQRCSFHYSTTCTSRSNEYGLLSFTNPRRTIARRLSTEFVATSSVHDHIAHSFASLSAHGQGTIGHSNVASASSEHECYQRNAAALTFYQGVQKTAPLKVCNFYGSTTSNARNVARSEDYSNNSNGGNCSPVVVAAPDQQHATKFSFCCVV